MVETELRRISENFKLDRTPLYNSLCNMEPPNNQLPLTWERAKDFSVYDDQGNRWIDLTSGIFVANAGHANPEIKKAIQDQLDSDLIFSYNYPTHIKKKLVSKLLEVSPNRFDRVILVSTGSEATEAAAKLMRLQGTEAGRKYLIAFKGAYHGRTLGCDLISRDSEKASWAGIENKYVHFIDFPYEESDRFDPATLPPHGEIAGFMIETFQGWGACFYPDGYLSDLYRFARENGALICFDEMQAGFFRTGKLYGYMTYGSEIEPDFVCLGKGLSSSLPMGAVLTHRRVFDDNPKAELYGTHSGSPLVCAAALANIEFLTRPGNIRRWKKTSRVFLEEVRRLQALDPITKVSARGMVAAILFKNPETATRVVYRCIENGVLPVCTFRESIKLGPPLTITSEAIREAIQVLEAAIRAETRLDSISG